MPLPLEAVSLCGHDGDWVMANSASAALADGSLGLHARFSGQHSDGMWATTTYKIDARLAVCRESK